MANDTLTATANGQLLAAARAWSGPTLPLPDRTTPSPLVVFETSVA